MNLDISVIKKSHYRHKVFMTNRCNYLFIRTYFFREFICLVGAGFCDSADRDILMYFMRDIPNQYQIIISDL